MRATDVRPRRQAMPVLVGLSLVAALSTASSAHADGVSPSAVVAAVESATPDGAPGSSLEPLTLAAVGDTYVGESAETTTIITHDPNGDGLEISSPDDPVALEVGLPDLDLADAELNVGLTGAVFDGDAADVDFSVQAFDEGARIATTIYNSQAPDEFDYPVTVPAGGSIVVSPEGIIIVSDGAGDPVGYFGQPWARDANGRTLPTHWEVSGDTVKQVVEHRQPGVAYPVVADPFAGKKLIADSNWDWIPRNSTGSIGAGWTLRVRATSFAWSWSETGGVVTGHSYIIGDAGWKELYKSRKNRGLNVNLRQHAGPIHLSSAVRWNILQWSPNLESG